MLWVRDGQTHEHVYISSLIILSYSIYWRKYQPKILAIITKIVDVEITKNKSRKQRRLYSVNLVILYFRMCVCQQSRCGLDSVRADYRAGCRVCVIV